MSYLDEFRLLIEEEKLAHFLRLWEEYCMADQVDGKELSELLALIKNSTLAQTFGQFAETVLTLWKKIEPSKEADAVLRLILDLQTTNSVLLADLATAYLKKYYSDDKFFNEKLRIVGLLTRRSFQGAITNFELLNHMAKSRFVFHTGGWGVGEVIDISLLREHARFEFEGITAPKELSFDNAFKNLVALPSEHFLARRFGDADRLEQEGREDPLALIHLLLRDLGSKTAQEIKEELAGYVIHEEEWSKWWQLARAKIKKDTKIKSPQSTKERFEIRDTEVSHESRLKEILKETKGIDQQIQIIYNFIRDFPEILKNQDMKQQIKSILFEGLGAAQGGELELARKIQITFLLEDIFPDEFPNASAALIGSVEEVEKILDFIDILVFKKRTLSVVREQRNEWPTIFLHLLFSVSHNPIRDYIFKELQNDPTTNVLLKDKIHELLNRMTLYPDAFFWYFQKLVENEDVPLNDKQSKLLFLEAYLVLLHFVENKPEHRELAKKMHQLLIAKRYAVIRALIEGASIEYLREFLLLASKCLIFSKQDLRILQSLAEVVQPALSKKKEREEEEQEEILWTTREGYQKVQERLQYIGTVETIDNAREIEAARAKGDLRENAEYKFALERRTRLQAEMQVLSRQINQARILTKEDISLDRVGVGVIVDLADAQGNKTTYTLLGPWDADPEQHIISFQSKLAQAMAGCKTGDRFAFHGTEYTIKAIKSFL